MHFLQDVETVPGVYNRTACRRSHSFVITLVLRKFINLPILYLE